MGSPIAKPPNPVTEHKFTSGQKPFTFEGSLTVRQGTLTTIVGPTGEGKTILLKLIDDILPSKIKGGEVLAPCHSKVLPITVPFMGSLYDNLVLGIGDNRDNTTEAL